MSTEAKRPSGGEAAMAETLTELPGGSKQEAMPGMEAEMQVRASRAASATRAAASGGAR